MPSLMPIPDCATALWLCFSANLACKMRCLFVRKGGYQVFVWQGKYGMPMQGRHSLRAGSLFVFETLETCLPSRRYGSRMIATHKQQMAAQKCTPTCMQTCQPLAQLILVQAAVALLTAVKAYIFWGGFLRLDVRMDLQQRCIAVTTRHLSLSPVEMSW